MVITRNGMLMASHITCFLNSSCPVPSVAEYNATNPITTNRATQIKILHSIFFKVLLFIFFRFLSPSHSKDRADDTSALLCFMLFWLLLFLLRFLLLGSLLPLLGCLHLRFLLLFLVSLLFLLRLLVLLSLLLSFH